MIVKLNDNQKQYLFDKHYVTRKALDSLSYAGWEKFFIENFNWSLDLSFNRWYMNDLILINKDTGEESYRIYLNFQEEDLTKLLNIL